MEAVKKRVAKKWRKPAYWRVVESKLKRYPQLKKAVKDRDMIDLFPPCTPVYEEKVSAAYSEYQSSTEKYGIKRASKRLEVERMENALCELSDLQKAMIEAVYFSPNEFPGVAIFCEQHGISKRKYHLMKKEAIDKIAEVLNLVG